jgi:hypothetical protein
LELSLLLLLPPLLPLPVAQVVWQRCSFSNNSARTGAVLFCMSTSNTTLANCLLQHNRAVNSAAVHVAEDASASIIDSRLENNTAAVSPKGDGGNGGSVGVIDRAKVSGWLQPASTPSLP